MTLPVLRRRILLAVLPAFAGSVQSREARIWMPIGERRISVRLADNAAARAFAAMLPLTLDMPDLNGDEKHVRLPKALPSDAAEPGTLWHEAC